MRIFTLLIIALFCLLSTKPSFASDAGIYVGGDVVFSKINTDESSELAPEDYGGLSPYVGYQFNKNFAIELGYFSALEETGKVTSGSDSVTVDTRFYSFYGDLVGMYPLNEKLSLLGSVGYERTYAEADLEINLLGTKSNDSVEDDGNSYRFGVGLKYDITPKIGVRTMFRYVVTDFNNADDYMQGTLGLSYKF